MRIAALVAVLAIVAFPVAAVETITVIGFNLESDGARIGTLVPQVASIDGCDIWGFVEVKENWEQDLTSAAADGEGATFASVLGTTGGMDRMLIVYDEDRFEYLDYQELHHLNWEGRVRSPLVGHFKIKSTGQEFFFMVNHLYRSRSEKRHEQAQGINEWAQQQSIPVIAVGDYNFDWSVTNGPADHDEGFDYMVAGGVFTWIEPTSIIRTQCSSYDSVLDFVFASGAAQQWEGFSEILFADPDYCPDDDTTSDHRPVMATFTVSEGISTKEMLLQRIADLESAVGDLKQVVEGMSP